MSIRIIYPQTRTVSEEQINTWFEDAVTNGEIERSEIEAFDEPLDVWSKADLLDDAGIITLSRHQE
jgi:hypothetical protein